MVTADDVKEYLHIPYDDDDTMISNLIDAGYVYLANAIDNFSSLQSSDTNFSAQADLWIKTQWMPCMYDNREGMTAGEEKLNYVARSLLTQMQMTKYVEEEDSDD